MPGLQGSGSTTQGDTGYTNEASTDTIPDPFVQNLFVLCHGEQVIDNADVTQKGTTRSWDSPLTARGKLQAWRVGRNIRLEDWNVTRVVVAPYLRCVQTAVEVIAGLCMETTSSVQMRDRSHGRSPGAVSFIKASIECGLAENLTNKPWTLDLAELYSMLPNEIHDPPFQPRKQKLPLGRETMEDVQYRYTSTLNKTANRYPHENIICITHGEGMQQLVSMMWPPTEMHGVTYCAYMHAQRPIFERDNGSYILNDDWELLTESGASSGVFFQHSV